MTPRVVAVVLAAGRATRFGSSKLLAPLDGRPVLAHVLDRIAASGIEDVVVVLGEDAAATEAALDWPSGTRRVVNPDPARGLASSLALGFAEARAGGDPAAILVALGDQPRIHPDVVGGLLTGIDDPCSFIVPRYADDANPNPVVVCRPAFDLISQATGDRGLGPVIAQHPELVWEMAMPGWNPDIDTPDDLAAVERAGDETAGGPLRHPVS